MELASPPKGKMMAGIIPLAGKIDVFGMPWPDYLHPVSSGYTAVERSVFECALAGCDVIWIVCNDDVAPLVKDRIGDYILNPKIFKHWSFIKNKEDHKEYIPVFYTPIDRKDRERRDSLGWSILHGSLTAYLISQRMSNWVVPSKYYVSFPWGIYDPAVVAPYRSQIRSNKGFYLSHKEETVHENKYLGFTFSPEEWIIFKRNVKQNCTGGSKKIAPTQRWSSKNFSLDKIFKSDIIDIGSKVAVPEYFEASSWDNLLEYYRSGILLSAPSKLVIKPYFMKEKR